MPTKDIATIIQPTSSQMVSSYRNNSGRQTAKAFSWNPEEKRRMTWTTTHMLKDTVMRDVQHWMDEAIDREELRIRSKPGGS